MLRPAVQFHKVFKVEQEGETVVVIPQGHPIAFRYNEIHVEANAVIRLLDDAGLKNVVLDFSVADYASSMILGAMIRMARKVTNEGGQAVMCHANENMLDILTTMNLIKLWPYYATREEAVAAISAVAS